VSDVLREKAREMAERVIGFSPEFIAGEYREAMAIALEWAGSKTRMGGYLLPADLRAAAKRLREGDE
jgi:hypothetical protein